MKDKTINDFIKELQAISPDKRELPLMLDCPNGVEIYPKIQMGWDEPINMLAKAPDKMVITAGW